MNKSASSHYIGVEPNLKLYARDWGVGPTILLVHGWPFNHTQYEYQILDFVNQGYRCVALDMRGAGKSDAPWSGYAYDDFADDIKKVIDRLKLDNIILAGFSIGGPMVLRYLARHKQYKVSKVLFLSPAAPLFTQREDFPYGFKKSDVDKLIEQSLTDRPTMLEGFTDILFNKKHSSGIINWINHMSLTMAPNATVDWLKTLRDSDLRPDMSKITIPTAIFHGKKDKICVFKLGETMHENIPGSKLVPFEDSGHGLWYDEREKFNKEFIKFIKS